MKPRLTAPVRRGLLVLVWLYSENLIAQADARRMRARKRHDLEKAVRWIEARDAWQRFDPRGPERRRFRRAMERQSVE